MDHYWNSSDWKLISETQSKNSRSDTAHSGAKNAADQWEAQEPNWAVQRSMDRMLQSSLLATAAAQSTSPGNKCKFKPKNAAVKLSSDRTKL